jgi:hypothetical protein
VIIYFIDFYQVLFLRAVFKRYKQGAGKGFNLDVLNSVNVLIQSSVIADGDF